MTKYSKIAALTLCLTVFSAGKSQADYNIAGEWLVADGTAHIRTLVCNNLLWGVINWVNTPDTDKNNPDSTKQNQPILGLPIIPGMQANKAEDRWEGHIYNAENGKTYSGTIRLADPDILHIEGCLFDGMLCGGEDWTRITPDPANDSADALCKRFSVDTK